MKNIRYIRATYWHAYYVSIERRTCVSFTEDVNLNENVYKVLKDRLIILKQRYEVIQYTFFHNSIKKVVFGHLFVTERPIYFNRVGATIEQMNVDTTEKYLLYENNSR